MRENRISEWNGKRKEENCRGFTGFDVSGEDSGGGQARRLEAVFVESQEDALARARENPAVIILDLNHSAGDPLETVVKLKSDAQTSQVKLLCYVSHVQADLKRAAQEKGCDLVIARSAFSQNLMTILARYAA